MKRNSRLIWAFWILGVFIGWWWRLHRHDDIITISMTSFCLFYYGQPLGKVSSLYHKYFKTHRAPKSLGLRTTHLWILARSFYPVTSFEFVLDCTSLDTVSFSWDVLHETWGKSVLVVFGCVRFRDNPGRTVSESGVIVHDAD